MKKINKIKVEYYSREFLKYLLLTGLICVAGSSPYFVSRLIKTIPKFLKYRASKRKFTDAFHYLKKRGMIEIKREGHDVSVALTAEGKKQAGKYQINDLIIETPKKWDKKWRVVIFDIPASARMIRDIFRKKLKEFEFYPLQKSIWVYPFACKKEIEFLRDFFGLNKRQIQVLEVVKLDEESFLRKHFQL